MSRSRSLTFLAALSVAVGLAAPPEARAAAPIKHSAEVSSPVKVDISPPLRTITPKAAQEGRKAPENPPIPKQGRALGKPDVQADAALQQRPGSAKMPAPIVNFEGVNNIDGVYPPDTTGDVGPNHFIQWVNLHFQIYNKTGTSLYGPAAGNTLWTGFGGACETQNDGDIQVNYDHLADRWVMSQFTAFAPAPFHQCFAVSQTADPLGAWYRYDFIVSPTKLNDYPKIGVWPDGYYMTANQFNASGTAFLGLGVWVLQRDQMLLGNPALMIYFDTGAVTLNYGGALPADLDGPPPPAGTPGYVMEWDDSTWLGDPTDTMRIWEVHVDWTNPATSTFGLNAAYDPNFKIPTANALPLCFSCIPQPGTAQVLDSLADRLMQRLQYRYIAGAGKLTVNHTVDAGSGRAGVRWYQFTNPGAGWTMADQGTFAGGPGDSDYRWMGAAALDIQGNLAVGYSVSSSTTYPSIRYNGRLAGDPAGTLGTEASIIIGTGSQTGSAGRWGDYSALLVDPVDECTFWYTTEYIQTTGGAPWQTRVASFKFPGCVNGPSGTIDGTVRSTAGGDPIPGATVQIGPSYSTTTNGAGFFSIIVPEETYDVTASKFGFSPTTVTGQEVTDGATTHVGDILLTPIGEYAVDGFVTAAIHNWPLWAKIEIRQGGTLYYTVYTSPWNGYYEVMLPNGYTYDFTVQSMYQGYQSEVRPVTVASGSQVQNFSLLAGSGNPAYNCYLDGGINEQFEGAFPPLGWTVINNGAGPNNVWKRNDVWGRANNTGGTGFSADADSDMAGSGSPPFNTELWSPPIKMPATPRNLKFKHNFNFLTTGDSANVAVSTNGGGTWTTLLNFLADNTTEQTVNMTAYANQFIVLRWRYTSVSFAWWWEIDDVRTETIPVPPAAVLSEAFEGTVPPTGWSQVDSAGSGVIWKTNVAWGRANIVPGGTGQAAGCDVDSAGSGLTYDCSLISSAFDVSTLTTPTLSVKVNYNDISTVANRDFFDIDVSSDGGTTWVSVVHYAADFAGTATFDLTGKVSGANNKLRFRYYTADLLAHWDWYAYIDDVAVTGALPPVVADTPSLLCDPVAGSLIAGYVTDVNTTLGLVGALVTRDLGGVAVSMPASTDPAVGPGFYYMFSGAAVPTRPTGPSTRTFTASKTGYGPVAHSVNLTPDTVNRLDFALPSGLLSLEGWPFNIDGRLTPDGQPTWDKTQTFSILNTGGLPANVKLKATALGSGWVPPRPLEPLAALRIAPEATGKLFKSLKGVPLLVQPRAPVRMLAAGDVLNSWSTGLTAPWGIGTDPTNVWVSSISLGGGDDYDYQFTSAGTPTGAKINTAPWNTNGYAADFAYNPNTGKMWQMNVQIGTQNIQELDPVTGTSTGNSITVTGPSTWYTGLAYDPTSDSFFIGGWNDGMIIRFSSAGTIVQSKSVGLSIAGLAYNPDTQHLFVIENSGTDTVTVLDVPNDYAVLGSFNIAGFGSFAGAGLEFGCDGLWATNQNDGKAYLVDAGESYPCNPNLSWFTMTPTQGVVPGNGGSRINGQLDILCEFFPEGVPAANFGLYRALVTSTNDTPFALPTIPVYFTKAYWDVPRGAINSPFIHGLAGARVTRSCGGGNYCPSSTVSRAEMAVTIVRGIHGPDFVPPAAVGIFADVTISDTDTTADYIEQLFNDGVVAGCALGPPRLYCPDDLVNRAQMSVFITKGILLPPVIPPTGYFTDMAGYHWAEPFAEALFNAGITVGCGDHQFCPAFPITRGQLAVWLVKGLGIPYYVHSVTP